MKMFKVLFGALSLLSMTAQMSANPALVALAGCIVARPLAHQVKEVGKAFQSTRCTISALYLNSKINSECQDQAKLIAEMQYILKHDLYRRSIPNVFIEVSKLAVTEALAAGAILVAAVY